MRQGKKWGYTTEFFRSAIMSAHHLEIKKGGHSSEHKHDHKHNLFYVMSGRLEITIFREHPKHMLMPDVEDVTVLTAGQSSAVPPGFFHKFQALEDTECVEIYQVMLEEPDIERRTQGGMEE